MRNSDCLELLKKCDRKKAFEIETLLYKRKKFVFELFEGLTPTEPIYDMYQIHESLLEFKDDFAINYVLEHCLMTPAYLDHDMEKVIEQYADRMRPEQIEYINSHYLESLIRDYITNVEVLQYFKNAGIDCQKYFNKNTNVLGFRYKVVEKIKQLSCVVNLEQIMSKSDLFHHMCISAKKEEVEYLLEKYPKISRDLKYCTVNHNDFLDEDRFIKLSPLMFALKAGNYAVAEILPRYERHIEMGYSENDLKSYGFINGNKMPPKSYAFLLEHKLVDFYTVQDLKAILHRVNGLNFCDFENLLMINAPLMPENEFQMIDKRQFHLKEEFWQVLQLEHKLKRVDTKKVHKI